MPTTDHGERRREPDTGRGGDDRAEYAEEYDDEEEEEEYADLTPAEAARAAAAYVAELTGKELRGVVSVEPQDSGWLVGVEVVEDRRIPSTNDVLGLYQAHVDPDGVLLTYRRTRRYLRGRADGGEGN
jgi:Gas vesicle synthesis protein GvpO